MSTAPLLNFGINADAVSASENVPSEKTYIPNNQDAISQARQAGESFTKKRIASGDLVVDAEGNLQVTQHWIEKIKKNISPNYDVIAEGASIILIDKTNLLLRAGGGVTKIVNTWKGFDLYLKDSDAKNVPDAQQIAGIIAPIVGGPLGAVLGGLAAASGSSN